MSLNLVLMGPPGSGKGTQAQRLARRFSIPHVSTGDILRRAVRDGTPLGRQVAAIMARGALVSDDLMADLVGERLAQPDMTSDFILDGFPRTIAQAHALDRMVAGKPLVIALIEVTDEEILHRLSSRRICTSCGMTQSVSDAAAPQNESCPYCGGALIRRADDDPETVRQRLATYAAEADPLIEHYTGRPGFLAVNGAQPPERVTAALIDAIERARQNLEPGARRT